MKALIPLKPYYQGMTSFKGIAPFLLTLLSCPLITLYRLNYPCQL